MLVGAPNGDDGSAAGEGGDGNGGNNRTKKRGEIRPVEKHHMMLDKEQVGTGEWKENGKRKPLWCGGDSSSGKGGRGKEGTIGWCLVSGGWGRGESRGKR
jgi:hypothetical protein